MSREPTSLDVYLKIALGRRGRGRRGGEGGGKGQGGGATKEETEPQPSGEKKAHMKTLSKNC